jgi:hypothetical protein
MENMSLIFVRNIPLQKGHKKKNKQICWKIANNLFAAGQK